MEIDRLFGLPAHPLIVHAPVVFTPLVVLAAIALALRPAWLTRFGIPLAVSAIVLSGMCIAATGSGEQLQGHLRETALIEDHQELGDQMQTIVFLFTAMVLGLVGYDRLRRAGRALPAVGATILTALVVLSGIGATVWDVRTGHAGAKAVWNNTSTSVQPEDGGDGD